jgi:hypothetical protein
MNAQTIANKVWEANGGTPADDLIYQQSALDNMNNLIIVGNTYTTGQEENVWIAKYDPEGTLLWQYEYNYASNGRDYATNVITDANGNIFVTGSIFNNLSNTFDFLTLKISPTGTLQWTATHDANGFDDIAADIALDGNGNIYITGGSQISASNWNYTTIKYDANGTLIWTQQYDYANLRDVAVNIEVSNNAVIVTGASANTPQEWDYATLHYDENGVLQNTERTASGITGFDQPMDMVQDANGYIYITGRGTQNGINYDIQTVKLSPTLVVEWVATFDGSGFQDGAADLEVDAFENVYIVGYTQNDNLTTDLLVVKYDKNGNQLWERTRSSDTGNAKATAAKVNPNGSIIVTGEVQNGTQTDFITLKYSPSGVLQWEQRYDPGTQEDRPQSVETDADGNIYVTGTSDNGLSSTYTTIKYETYERNLNTENSQTTGRPSHISNELIIRFRTDIVNTTFVNNRELFYAPLSEIITDVNAINTLQNAMNAAEDFPEWTLLKVYPNLTTEMTTTSRMGRTFVVPEIWTTFVLRIPNDFDPDFDEFVVSDNLMGMNDLQKYIRYVEPNIVFEATATTYDVDYSIQSGLYNPVNGINVEGAWDYTTGEEFVKVGVFDMGLNWNHREFDESFGTQPVSIASKVKGGYNCDLPSFTILDENSGTLPSGLSPAHGMQSAGLIGAMRNNPYAINPSSISACLATNVLRRGIAGIAGGNWCDDINAIEKGVSLYDMQVQISPTGSNTFTPASQFAQGYVLATQSGNAGLALHITNHSYGIPSSDPNFSNYTNTMKNAVYFMYRSDAVSVFARGNEGDDEHHAPATTTNEEWVLSVGGSNNSQIPSTNPNPQLNGKHDIRSSYGKNVDLIAPYDKSLIHSLGLGNNEYADFSGTSAAAPHVTGTAGLLLSYLNDANNSINNLNQDDVEYILQATATDIIGGNGTSLIGYDDENGWGRLNATAALQFVDKSQYHILHFPELGAGSSMTITPTSVIIDMYKPNYLSTQGNLHYLVLQAYEVIITYNHQSYVGNANFENAWIRNSAAEGYEASLSVSINDLEYKWCELLSADNQQAVTRTYLYKIIGYHNSTLQNYTPNPNANYNWWGIPPYSGNVKCPYTLRVSGAITNTQQVEEESAGILKIYPVPTSDAVTIEFALEEATDVILNVFDLNGRLI